MKIYNFYSKVKMGFLFILWLLYIRCDFRFVFIEIERMEVVSSNFFLFFVVMNYCINLVMEWLIKEKDMNLLCVYDYYYSEYLVVNRMKFISL